MKQLRGDWWKFSMFAFQFQLIFLRMSESIQVHGTRLIFVFSRWANHRFERMLKCSFPLFTIFSFFFVSYYIPLGRYRRSIQIYQVSKLCYSSWLPVSSFTFYDKQQSNSREMYTTRHEDDEDIAGWNEQGGINSTTANITRQRWWIELELRSFLPPFVFGS